MRRRRDQADPGRRVAHLGHDLVDLLDRHRLASVLLRGFEPKQAADREQLLRLLVADLGIGAVLLGEIAAHRVLERRDGRCGPGMLLATYAKLVLTADVQRIAIDRRIAEGFAVPPHRLLGDLAEPY